MLFLTGMLMVSSVFGRQETQHPVFELDDAARCWTAVARRLRASGAIPGSIRENQG